LEAPRLKAWYRVLQSSSAGNISSYSRIGVVVLVNKGTVSRD
jgi:hypothetical protein